MPVNEKAMAAMKQQYGKARGEKVYYAVEAKAKKKRGKKAAMKKA